MALETRQANMAALWSVVVVVVVTRAVQAMQYTVGGPTGWVLGVDMEAWAAQNQFYVGDELYFMYTYQQSSVQLVVPEDYKDCNTNHAVSSDGGMGDMVMTLESPQTYYFISGHSEQCMQGLRLKVDVLAAPPPPGTPFLLTPPYAGTNPNNNNNIPSSPVILSPPHSIVTPYSAFRPSASSPRPLPSALLALILALTFTYYLTF